MIIGKDTENKDVSINLTKLISTRLLIQANSGGGKSWLIRKLLEESHGQVQQIVIDLEGEFSTLREKYDYLLVGPGGEIPTNIKTADLLARKLLNLKLSSIIDLSELKHHERITFVKRFLDSLISAHRELWHACLVVVDEAHQFCPEKSKSESADSVIDLLTRGRKRGFCGVLATQRIAKLNKDAAAECTNGFVGRTVLDIDRKRAAYDLGLTTKAQELSLKKLDDGLFLGYGPAISKEDYIKVQIGNVKTTHPEPGKSILKPSPTPDNVKKMLKDVIDLPKEVEEELKTKQDMQKKINELKRDLRMSNAQSKPLIKVDEKGLERAFAQGFKESERKNEKLLKVTESNCKQLERKISDIGKIVGQKVVFQKLEQTKQTYVPEVRTKQPSNTIHNERVLPRENIGNESYTESTLGICAKKIYSFLYNHGDRAFSKSHIGAFTGYSNKSGGFNNALSQLNSRGLIIKSGGTIQVKEFDASLVEEFDFSKEKIMQTMGVCPKKIYQLLLDNPYQEYSKEEVGEITGYSSGSGGFNNALSKLNSLGLIIKNGSSIKLNPELLE